jgi:hypothetical protein
LGLDDPRSNRTHFGVAPEVIADIARAAYSDKTAMLRGQPKLTAASDQVLPSNPDSPIYAASLRFKTNVDQGSGLTTRIDGLREAKAFPLSATFVRPA